MQAPELERLYKTLSAQGPDPEALALAFGHACAERVRHLLEEPAVIACLDRLADWRAGRCTRSELDQTRELAAALANRHPGSRSIDGVGHAAVSASYAVAQAIAGHALQASEYAAYAAVYGAGGYGAVCDRESFLPEHEWQLRALVRMAAALGQLSPDEIPHP